MAGLQKYEDTEEWKNKFKKLLFMERKNVLKTTETIKETQRYSMDIGLDLKNILKEKNIPPPGDTPKANKLFGQENKENRFKSEDFKNNRVHFKDIKPTQSIVDDTLFDFHVEKTEKQNISDESFEAMEKMCDKTASDPDSTLFQYLNGENKREVMEATKKRLSAIEPKFQPDCDAEEATFDKVLRKVRGEDQQELADESPLKGVEMTQIEDIEAPSRFWDSTMLQTSPVKMVGLLRPSTIMEECADEFDISSAQTSYKSAAKALPSEISSSCYETASETASFFYNPLKCIATDFDPLYIESTDVDKEADPLLLQDEDIKTINKSVNLLDFEKTMAANNVSLTNTSAEVVFDKMQAARQEEANNSVIESDESVIELLSDEENPLSPFCNQNPFLRNNVPTPSNDQHTTLIKWETPFNVKKEITTSFNDSLNTSIISTTHSPGSEKDSLHFNDTLEEVEYMMKKGMEMIKADKAAIQSPTTNHPTETLMKTHAIESPMKAKNTSLTPKILKEKQNTFTISPAKGKDQVKSPFTGLHAKRHELSPNPKRTPIPKSTPKLNDRFALNMKPMPKLNLFKKPTSACKPATSLTPHHKDQFAHVVSPIGTYMKKTAMTPLMTTTKTNTDSLNSTAFRELEYESRLHRPQFNLHDNLGPVILQKSPNNAPTLPKKAYISSELRQVRDERSPVTIPGGKKIQRYLDAAVMPTVIRHDGKAKITDCKSKLPIKLQKTGESSTNSPKRQESKDISLANLSIMSGDVSVYTLKDAQKL